MQQKHTAPEKSNNLAVRYLQNQFVTNLHEAYALMRYKIEYCMIVGILCCITHVAHLMYLKTKSFTIYFTHFKNKKISQLKSMSVKSEVHQIEGR